MCVCDVLLLRPDRGLLCEDLTDPITVITMIKERVLKRREQQSSQSVAKCVCVCIICVGVGVRLAVRFTSIICLMYWFIYTILSLFLFVCMCVCVCLCSFQGWFSRYIGWGQRLNPSCAADPLLYNSKRWASMFRWQRARLQIWADNLSSALKVHSEMFPC